MAGFVRRGRLAPRSELRTLRRLVELQGDGGVTVAGVVDDEVSVFHGRRLEARFREIEVEVYEGLPDGSAEAIVARLQEAGAGPPDPTPKIVRALGPVAAAPELLVGDAGPEAPAGEAVRRAVAASVVRLLHHDPGVRLGEDPEDVHQARVATRRLRSDLRTFAPLVDADWAAGLRSELSWLAGLLGPVRDVEVMAGRLRERLGTLPEEDRAGGAPLLDRLAAEREKARAALLAGIREPRYLDLLDRLIEAGRAPKLAPDAGGRAADVLPPLAVRPWRRLRKAVAGLGPQPSDEDLHQVRIRTKRCRYAAEAVAPVAPKSARAFAKRAAGLQEVLGDHQDAVIACGWIREAAEEGTNTFVAGELAGLELAGALATRYAWRRSWRRLDRKGLRAWM